MLLAYKPSSGYEGDIEDQKSEDLIMARRTNLILFAMILLPCFVKATNAVDCWWHIRAQVTDKMNKDTFSLVSRQFCKIDGDQTTSLTPKCTSLKIGYDISWDQQDESVIFAMSNTVSSLGYSIQLTGVAPLGDRELTDLSIRFPRLKMLDLSGCKALGAYNTLPGIVPFDKMYGITIEGIKKFESISNLMLGQYPNVSAQDISQLTTLAELDVSHNSTFNYDELLTALPPKGALQKVKIDKETFNTYASPKIDKSLLPFFIVSKLPIW
jgi:hypothetical protein